MSVMPSTYFSILPLSHDSILTAKKLVTRNVASIGSSFLHAISRLYFTVIIIDVTDASSPERVVASPYEGIRNGSAVIMKIPNPNPVVRCTNAAPIVNNIRVIIADFSIFRRVMGTGTLVHSLGLMNLTLLIL